MSGRRKHCSIKRATGLWEPWAIWLTDRFRPSSGISKVIVNLTVNGGAANLGLHALQIAKLVFTIDKRVFNIGNRC